MKSSNNSTMSAEIALLLLTFFLALAASLQDVLPGGVALRRASIVLLAISTVISVVIKVRAHRSHELERAEDARARIHLERLVKQSPRSEDLVNEVTEGVAVLLQKSFGEVAGTTSRIWQNPDQVEVEGFDHSNDLVTYLLLEEDFLASLEISIEPLLPELSEVVTEPWFDELTGDRALQVLADRLSAIIWTRIRNAGYNPPLTSQIGFEAGTVDFWIADVDQGPALSFSHEDVKELSSLPAPLAGAVVAKRADAWLSEIEETHAGLLPAKIHT